MSLFLQRWAKLYTSPTKSEIALEPAVAALGRPYRAQHPIFAAGAIADFALLDERIIFEVDGKSHASKAAQEKDRERTRKLERMGWVVARCTNDEALEDPKSCVGRMILQAQDRRNALAILESAIQATTTK